VPCRVAFFRRAQAITRNEARRKLPAAFSGPARGILERTGDVGDVSSLAMCDCRSGGWPQARPMDQRIESFLADVLALAGEDPDAVRDGVRVALAKCEAIAPGPAGASRWCAALISVLRASTTAPWLAPLRRWKRRLECAAH
jgi:hypothetical protein